MGIDEKKKRDIMFHAKKLLYYNELLIKQCDGWLSAEEGNANMIKVYMEKTEKNKKKNCIAMIFSKYFK
jgi:hypothetical protein